MSSGLESDLANLHLRLQDDSDSSFFCINTSAFQKGKGVFASRNFERGDLILSERPIFCVATYASHAELEPLWQNHIDVAVRDLSPANLDAYLSLQNSHNRCSCFRGDGPLMGIFATNAYGVSVRDGGICLKASRINHSCSPNARFCFDSNSGEIRIYALGTIARGEEISVSYIGCRRLFERPRLSRQAHLRSRYHFTCACPVCSLPEAESKRSDVRRQRINELWNLVGHLTAPTQKDQCVNAAVEAMRLLREEGYWLDAAAFFNEARPVIHS